MNKRVAFKVFKRVAEGRAYRTSTFKAAYKRFTESMLLMVRIQGRKS